MKRNRNKGVGGPTVPSKDNIIEQKKRVKITKEEAQRILEYKQGVMLLQREIGDNRSRYLDEEGRLFRLRKAEINKHGLATDEIKKAYKIIGEVVGFDQKTNEVILK